MSNKSKLKRFRVEILLALLLGCLFLVHKLTFDVNYTSYAQRFQTEFDEKSNKLDRLLLYEKYRYENFDFDRIWERKVDENFALHIYRNDSLIFWSTNEMPILNLADIHFPSNGLVHLQNGWYYAKTLKVGKVVFCSSFLIKKEYSYENSELENVFNPDFGFNVEADLSLEPGAYDIKDSKGQFLFSILPEKNQPITTGTAGLFLFLLVGIFALLVILVQRYLRKLNRGRHLISILVTSLLGYLYLHVLSLTRLKELSIFQPNLFGLSELLPNFMTYLILTVVLSYLLWVVHVKVNSLSSSRWKRVLLLFFFFAFYLYWTFLVYLVEGLIENADIPMRIDQIFTLNVFSLAAAVSFGVLFFGYFRILRLCAVELMEDSRFQSTLYVLIFFSGTGYFFYDLIYGVEKFYPAIFPGLFLTTICIFYRNPQKKNEFIYGVILLLLMVSCLNNLMTTFNQRKEKGVRELFANQLQTDQDIITELEFVKVKKELKNDKFLKKFTTKTQTIGWSDFNQTMEVRLFNGMWEQYEVEFFLFDQQDEPFLKGPSLTKDELDQIIQKHGVVSEIDSNVYFIADYIRQYSYLFRYSFEDDLGQKNSFYITCKSKRIPEEIGFPRLLISENAKVFEFLEEYSIAKYYHGKLVTHYGEYKFPVLIDAFKLPQGTSQVYLDRGNYNHYYLNSGKGQAIFLSTKNQSWIDTLTGFSYLFCFYGLLLLPLLFRNRDSNFSGSSLTLEAKIKFVMISLVFLSLLIYGWGSGIFVRNQYNDYTNQIISEKLNSVTMEFQSKFQGMPDTLDFDNPYLERALQKFARVFVTDINFYDTNGFLIASSRPKVYNVGLLSEQMNATAMSAMKLRNESEFVHPEQIGKLVYSSAYQPFIDQNGKLKGYLNLQHFGQQKDFESQIQRFLMAIVNVFVFLLAISAVVAILVSGWLTEPLRLLQERFSKVNFGKLNEPIVYHREDEIGALVQEYNRKIDELALTAQQLAQSERENAWREMAKQVAHEIKNPLTPMKLSLQHFQRIYDPQAPISREKLDQLVASLVEQIDGLTRIANDFSNFAKMPTPNQELVDLKMLIIHAVDIFSQAEMIQIKTNLPSKDVHMNADKDMILRILNNLIKNAIQACASGGLVELTLEVGQDVLIEVKDSGTGMSEQVQSKLFVPYFTTKSTGTGLGLAMVKQMVELHKGSITFESKENVGTSFQIRFPLNKLK